MVVWSIQTAHSTTSFSADLGIFHEIFTISEPELGPWSLGIQHDPRVKSVKGSSGPADCPERDLRCPVWVCNLRCNTNTNIKSIAKVSLEMLQKGSIDIFFGGMIWVNPG